MTQRCKNNMLIIIIPLVVIIPLAGVFMYVEYKNRKPYRDMKKPAEYASYQEGVKKQGQGGEAKQEASMQEQGGEEKQEAVIQKLRAETKQKQKQEAAMQKLRAKAKKEQEYYEEESFRPLIENEQIEKAIKNYPVYKKSLEKVSNMVAEMLNQSRGGIKYNEYHNMLSELLYEYNKFSTQCDWIEIHYRSYGSMSSVISSMMNVEVEYQRKTYAINEDERKWYEEKLKKELDSASTMNHSVNENLNGGDRHKDVREQRDRLNDYPDQ